MPGTGMIAKGGCMACSDDEVIAAVDYMVDSSR
jgi:cytochrome c5